MKKEIKSDDVIFNFFKQICDEKDDIKCTELGNSWINCSYYHSKLVQVITN